MNINKEFDGNDIIDSSKKFNWFTLILSFDGNLTQRHKTRKLAISNKRKRFEQY